MGLSALLKFIPKLQIHIIFFFGGKRGGIKSILIPEMDKPNLSDLLFFAIYLHHPFHTHTKSPDGWDKKNKGI